MKATIDKINDSIDERAKQQLTDDEMEFASGGERVDRQTWRCSKCDFVYYNSHNRYEREYYENLHRQTGCDAALYT